jgi:hypothetical protein
MRNWDSNDEAGSGNCTADQDYEDAQRVCKHLGLYIATVLSLSLSLSLRVNDEDVLHKHNVAVEYMEQRF